jgi:hypothetical protein
MSEQKQYSVSPRLVGGALIVCSIAVISFLYVTTPIHGSDFIPDELCFAAFVLGLSLILVNRFRSLWHIVAVLLPGCGSLLFFVVGIGIEFLRGHLF